MVPSSILRLIMAIPSDIEIAQSAKLKPITEIAVSLGLTEDDIELYGKYKED